MPRERVPFPTEDAPNYNPEDPYADKIALADHRHYLLGRYFVQEARARILRDKMRECYAVEGVNYVTECKEIVDKYMAAQRAVQLNWMDAKAWRD